jgi:hypothetical protein
MRLLNTATFELKDFLSDLPPYAILSHTWGEDELVYEKFDTWDKASQGTPSTRKVFGFCSLAYRDGFEWCWLDTVCIDKTSSAELSESINSMFRWYTEATICYAYLADVEVDRYIPESLEQFERSRWHTRGWTLQELLAPKRVEFYDVDWDQIGTRYSLRHSISEISGIREQILAQKFEPRSSKRSYCVAEKMSWAAKRKTSRQEDIAYCLLGIFDISMSLLYGEGEQAFQRLQRKILAQTEDLSLFSWKGNTPWRLHFHHRLLADSPLDFSESTSKDNTKDWRYESLESGHYSVKCGNLPAVQPQGFVLGEPVKRINGFDLGMAFSGEHMAVLCRFRQAKNSSGSEYLCLPIVEVDGRYEKFGIPTRINLHTEPSEIHYKSIRILFQSSYHSKAPMAWAYLSRPALVLTLQNEEGIWNQFLRIEYGEENLVLLRIGLSELIVFYGVRASGIRVWTLVTDWEGFQKAESLLPDIKAGRWPNDFARHRLCDYLHITCQIKPRPTQWLRSQEGQMAVEKQQCENSVAGCEALFSLEIRTMSSKERLEKLEFVGAMTFKSDTIHHLFKCPRPRELLLAKKKEVWTDASIEPQERKIIPE